MADLRFTLIGEGPTDDALVPIIVWLLEHPSLALLPDADVASHFIDREQFTDLNDLGDVITATLYDFPSDLSSSITTLTVRRMWPDHATSEWPSRMPSSGP